MITPLQSSSPSTPTLVPTPPILLSPSTPLLQRRLKRRSKSLDDIGIKRKSHLWHYNDDSTPPTTPVISFGSNLSPEPTTTTRVFLCSNNNSDNNTSRRRRRHSSNSVVEPNAKECLRLANIYGWVTANHSSHDTRINRTSFLSLSQDGIDEEEEKTIMTGNNSNNNNNNPNSRHMSHASSSRSSLFAEKGQQQRQHQQQQQRGKRQQLHTSRSFTQGTTNKLSKMFARRRKSLHSSTPATAPTTPIIDFTHHRDEAKGIVSAIIAAASSEELGWVGVEDKNHHDPSQDQEHQKYQLEQEEPPPSPPIENDPHVFDLLERNSTRFITFSKRDENQLSSATVEKLVEKLTKEMDSEFLMDFFLTYRQFLSQIRLCKLLILRFRWALMEDADERRLVRIRTFVVIRHWLTHYWVHDFVPSRTLRFMLCTFLSQLRNHPIILSSPRDARIIKSLRNVLKRQRKLYSIKEDENGSIRSSIDTYSSSKTHRMLYFGTSGSAGAATATFPSTRSRGSRKDSAIGMAIGGKSGGVLPTPPKDLKPSSSTPTLFSRSKRVSSTTTSAHHALSIYHHHQQQSQRHRTSSMNGSSWSAKVNFGIRSIKRSVPSVCQTIWHTVHHNNLTTVSSSGSTSCQGAECICPIRRPERKRATSLIRSASRIFDHHHHYSNRAPRTSISTPIPQHQQQKQRPFLTVPSSRTTTTTTKDPKHPHPLCPLHTIPMTPNPSQQHPLRPSHPHHKHTSISTTTEASDHKSFILSYRSEVIAQQFYIIEQQMLQNVTWDELAELRWKNNSSARRSSTIVVSEQGELGGGGIEQLINYFNMTCQWVASEIVQSRSLETRVRVIEKYIRIALKCYHHRNYSTLMQILLGLQSPAVSRLEKTWQRIDHYECQIFNELKEMAKPFRNWKNVRMAMNKAIENIAESSAVESILTASRTDPITTTTFINGRTTNTTTTAPFMITPGSGSSGHHSNNGVPGCIPFLGLYLSDLVFNAELPTFIVGASSSTTTKEEDRDDDNDAQLRSRLSTHFVNYNKCRITASVIKHVLAFQVLSRTYDFDYYPELFSKLQKLNFLDNTEIRNASLLCEES
ncbi:ras guanine nucleotide exchange factor domain-containing protein [Phascolomyces articulosus]|uniref:Ras guanine nucleotide exchange factor domain-containing protein n=1 Tax=Phascolomyces articulosus TaxID=60185 RepID=A0AAD5PCT9_9FUNG|nr:ras guanine nucleotide exchange factor domain-containing protein [Phascolomyces articulosus]